MKRYEYLAPPSAAHAPDVNPGRGLFLTSTFPSGSENLTSKVFQFASLMVSFAPQAEAYSNSFVIEMFEPLSILDIAD